MRDWIIGDKEKTVEWRDSGYREDLLNLGSGRVWGLRCRPCQRWHGHGFLESRELLWCCGNGNLCSSGRVSHQRHSLMESDADVSCLASPNLLNLKKYPRKNSKKAKADPGGMMFP